MLEFCFRTGQKLRHSSIPPARRKKKGKKEIDENWYRGSNFLISQEFFLFSLSFSFFFFLDGRRRQLRGFFFFYVYVLYLLLYTKTQDPRMATEATISSKPQRPKIRSVHFWKQFFLFSFHGISRPDTIPQFSTLGCCNYFSFRFRVWGFLEEEQQCRWKSTLELIASRSPPHSNLPHKSWGGWMDHLLPLLSHLSS